MITRTSDPADIDISDYEISDIKVLTGIDGEFIVDMIMIPKQGPKFITVDIIIKKENDE